MIPIELEDHSHRKVHYDSKTNEELLFDSFDMIDEKREEADLKIAAHKMGVVRQFNSNVRNQNLEANDPILK